MESSRWWHRCCAALLALRLTACVGSEAPPREEVPLLPSEDPSPTPFDVSAVVAQVHFAFRSVGDRWEGGHSTYAVVATPGEVAVTPIHRARRGPSVTFAAERRGQGSLGDDGRLSLTRGEGQEQLRNAPAGVEQQWTFAARPAGHGDLVVRLRVTGAAYAGATATGLHFADPLTGLGVRYGHATWVDATGQGTPVPARWEHGAVVLTVPGAALDAASYPAVLDPLISPEFGVDEPVLAPDVVLTETAVASNGDGYLAVWIDGGRVLGALLDARGVLQEPAGFLLGPDPEDADRNSRDRARHVVVASNGHGYLVAWALRQYGSVDTDPIRFTAVSADGAVRDLGGRRFDRAALDYVDRPAVASNGTGYLVTWTRGSGRIEGARVDGDGATIDADAISISPDRGSAPAVASDGRDYLVAWTNHTGVEGALVRSNGAVEPAFLLQRPDSSPDSTVTHGTPALAFGRSSYLVAWSDGDHSTDLVGARVSRDGLVLDPDGILLSGAPSAQFAPSMSFDGRSFVVVWSDARDSEPCAPCDPPSLDCDCESVRDDHFTSAAIVGARVDVDGAVRDPDGVWIAPQAPQQFSAAVASVGGRGSMVVWGGPGGVLGRTLGRDGRPRGHSPALIAAGYALASSPSVASDGLGYLVVWQDLRGGVDWDLYGARVGRRGALLDPSGLAISTAPGDQTTPSVTFDGRRYLVAWQDHRGPDWDLYAARVSRWGEVRDPDGIAVSTAPGDQLRPSAAGSLLVWNDQRDRRPCEPCDASGCDDSRCDPPEYPSGVRPMPTRVFGARLDDGGRVLDPDGLAISPPGHVGRDPSAASNGAGYLVAWARAEGIAATRVGPRGGVRDPDGLTLSEPGALTPSVSTDGDGYFAVWSRPLPRLFTRCYGQPVRTIEGVRLNRHGRPLDPAVVPIATPPSSPSGVIAQNYAAPRAAFDGDGYLVAWESVTLLACDGAPARDVLGAWLGSDGEVLDAALPIETGLPEASRSPAIASDGAGRALVVYARTSSLWSDRSTVRAHLLTLPGARPRRW